jgi:hypothetical protein
MSEPRDAIMEAVAKAHLRFCSRIDGELEHYAAKLAKRAFRAAADELEAALLSSVTGAQKEMQEQDHGAGLAAVGTDTTVVQTPREVCGCGHEKSIHGAGGCGGIHLQEDGERECYCDEFWRRGSDGRRIWEPIPGVAGTEPRLFCAFEAGWDAFEKTRAHRKSADRYDAAFKAEWAAYASQVGCADAAAQEHALPLPSASAQEETIKFADASAERQGDEK